VTASATLDSDVAEARPPRPRTLRRGALIVGLAVALVALVLVSAGTGQLYVRPEEVLGALLRGIGIPVGPLPEHPQGYNALWTIRFPRVAMAVIVGAALAAAGLLMQAIFGNPLAEPGVVGVSSGAALGASAVIVFGWTFAGEWTIALVAFATGLLATLVVYTMSRAGGRTEVVTLVLTGIAINAFTGAGLAFLTFLGDQQAREQIVFWQLGSLNGSRWQQVGIVLPLIVVGLIVAFAVTRSLDLLALGEKSARHLGVNVELLRIVVIVVTALLVGSAVAFAGIIAFVGLVVPHLMRMIIGPAHLPLLVTSVLGGAVLLLAADLVARTAVPMADLPIGMLTSIVGGPFFFWLLRRTRSKAGGWG
jgi:iron complex transport system permease protein